MKSILTALAVTVLCLTGLSTRAEAGHRTPIGYSQTYVCGHARCGCPYYTKRVCHGYDRYQRPIFHYFRQPFRCKCKGKGHRHSKHAKKYYKAQEKYYKDRQKAYKKYSKKHKKHKKCK